MTAQDQESSAGLELTDRPLEAGNKRPSWITPNVVGFSLSSFFSDFSHELVTALLPGFLVVLGAPAYALGLIEGTSNFAQSLSGMWGGHLADRARSRVPWYLAAYVATALKAIIAFAPVWLWIVPIRLVAWIGRGARGPIRDSMIADEIAVEHRGKAYGVREACDTLGAIAGPLAAALLLMQLHYRLLIGLSVIPAVIAIVLVALLIRELPSRLDRNAEARAGLSRPFGSPSFTLFLAGTAAFACGYAAPTFFILRAEQLLTPHSGIVVAGTVAIALYTVHNVAYSLAAFPAGAAADRFGPARLLLGGYALWIIALAGFGVGPATMWLLVPFFVTSGIATGLIETTQTTWAAQMLPSDARGRGLGLLTAFTGFGSLISGLAVGFVWTLLSAAVAFGLSAVVAAVGLVITGGALRRWSLTSGHEER
jgi:MFS family permease